MHRLFDRLGFALERMAQHRALVFWSLVGLAAATTLALSLLLFVDSVNTSLLTAHLGSPPYAFRFRYLGSWKGNVTHDDVSAATGAIEGSFAGTLGLPTSRAVRYARGGAMNVRLTESRQSLGTYSLAALEGMDDLMTLVSGQWPVQITDDCLPVLMPESALYTQGVQVGSRLTAQLPGSTQPLTLCVAALWRATNPQDPAWIFIPSFFNQVMLTAPDALWNTIDGTSAHPVEEAAWSLVFDGSGLRTSDVPGLLARMADGQRAVDAALPGIRLDLSPSDGLNAFNDEVGRLTRQLVVVILPVAGLVLYFVTLVAGLLVGRQQAEDAVLRSRGMSRAALLSVHALMWLTLAGSALAVGLALSPPVVALVAGTVSFLRFDLSTSAPVHFSGQALTAGALTALIAAGSGLFMAWRGTRETVTSLQRAAARGRAAWWQRAYLDVILLVPALYVLYSLRQRGGIVAGADDPFADPLTFLGPTLFSLGLTLLFLRLLPPALSLCARIAGLGRGVALLMALRELTRSMGRYRGTLLMTGFTLGLIGYTASMASTLDRSLSDSVHYQIGADAVIVTATDTVTEQGAVDENTGQPTQTVTGYNTLPPGDLLRLDGVRQVSRVGKYPAQILLPNQRLDGTMIGVDRAALASLAFFRRDFAVEPLADLLNRLAGNRTGILLSAQTAAKYNLRVGQSIRLQISALDAWHETTVPIVGLIDFFPTVDPSKGFFALGNLDVLFETVGTELPHDLWLGLAPNANRAALEQQVRKLGYPIVQWRDPQAALRAALAEPSRRGVLGFLSVGFVAAVVLTLVASIVQNAVSLREQAAQLGSLRALGLAGSSVALYLLLVQGIAAMSGILSGTGIGVSAALLFLPLFDFSGGLPPYLVRVAWDDIGRVYAVFAGTLLVVTLTTALLMGRERLSTLVKLGDV